MDYVFDLEHPLVSLYRNVVFIYLILVWDMALLEVLIVDQLHLPQDLH